MNYETEMETPVGVLALCCNDKGLSSILFEDHKKNKVVLPELRTSSTKHPILVETVKQLSEYFEGKRREFNLPLCPENGTAFQSKVWESLQQIPYGKVLSYSEQTERLFGTKKSVRAVAAANSRNPLSIVVPCHRVVAANGNLHGYAGGLERKKFLLQLEGLQFVAGQSLRSIKDK